MVIGNLIIAILITNLLTKKQKKDEISLDHCIKDISELLSLLKEIKKEIEEFGILEEEVTNNYIFQQSSSITINPFVHQKKKQIKKKQEIITKSDVFLQLTRMLTNHPLIDESNLENIHNVYLTFEEHITGNETINEEWFDSVLKLQRHLLIMKSDVIKEFRK